VRLHSDSRYVVEAMNEGRAWRWKEAHWLRPGGKRVPNADLWERLLAVCARHDVTFQWVRGHAGNAGNERADALSYVAIERSTLLEDRGYLTAKEAEAQAPAKITAAGQPCRKCGTPVVRKTPARKRKPGQTYYYEFYLYCRACKTMYIVDAAKRTLDENA
jgi:hypothetical protein